MTFKLLSGMFVLQSGLMAVLTGGVPLCCVYLRIWPRHCKHLVRPVCSLPVETCDRWRGNVWLKHIFNHGCSCPPKIARAPWPYMCRPAACAWGGIMYLGHTIRAAGSLLLLTSRPITGQWGLSFCPHTASPCMSPSSTVSVSSTFSPSWTRTVGGVFP